MYISCLSFVLIFHNFRVFDVEMENVHKHIGMEMHLLIQTNYITLKERGGIKLM